MAIGLNVNIITPAEQDKLLSLRTTDTWRNGSAVRMKTVFSRIIFYFTELFRGGWNQNDRIEFAAFYARMRNNIQLVRGDLERGENLNATFHQVQLMLKTAAKISNSAWGRNLSGFESYTAFRRDVEDLRRRAAERVDAWAAEDVENRASIARWIKAGDAQRKFAAYLDLKDVPYRFNEIPKGAVILTDPNLYLQGTRLKKNGSILKTIELHIKAFLCWIATGMRYTHAELSLGDGRAFDLDKKKSSLWPQGEIRIQERGDKTCYGAVMAPNQDRILMAHQAAYRAKGLAPFETFEDLWNAIDAEARRSAPLIEARIMDLARVGMFEKRPADYDAMQAWAPGEKKYGCSATVSALFAHFGVDIGAQFNKMEQNVSPADFFRSEYFRPLFVV